MTGKAIELDERRGMAAQKATDLRRLLADVSSARSSSSIGIGLGLLKLRAGLK